jgi:hypothetical protein
LPQKQFSLAGLPVFHQSPAHGGMKKVFFALFALTSGAFAQGFAPVSQLPKGISSLSFDVRGVASGGGTNAAAANISQSNSKTRVRESQTVLELKVRNLSAQPASAQFDWFFLAQSVGKGKAYIWDKGTREIAVGAGSEVKENLESTDLVQTTTVTTSRVWVTGTDSVPGHYQNVSRSSKGGARAVGWIVRMFSDGKLVRIRASSSELEKMGYDPAFGTQPARPPGATRP